MTKKSEKALIAKFTEVVHASVSFSDVKAQITQWFKQRYGTTCPEPIVLICPYRIDVKKLLSGGNQQIAVQSQVKPPLIHLQFELELHDYQLLIACYNKST